MSETPLILAHNLFKDPSFIEASSENASYPATNLLDMTRHTLWKASASGVVNIRIHNKNLVRNPGAELNLNYWTSEKTSGTPVWTFTRNTSSPIKGNADFKIEKTSGSGVVRARSLQTFDLKANRTYVLSFLHHIEPTTLELNGGFLDSMGATFQDDGNNSWKTFQSWPLATITGTTFRFTPTVDHDGCMLAFWFSTDHAFHFDAVHFNEVRDPDTLIIDRGHNLKQMTMKAQFAATELDTGWSNPTGNNVRLDNNEAKVLQFTGPGVANATHFWRVRIESVVPAVPQISNLWLGEGWSLASNPERPFDPESEVSNVIDIETDAGFRRSFSNYRKRLLSAEFAHIDPTDEAPNWTRFWEDIRQGRDPFWWLWRPATSPKSPLYARLSDRKFAMPYDPYFRSAAIEAEEVGGKLGIQD